MVINASIIGATGYTGQELVRLLCRHPGVKIAGLGTQTYAGRPLSDVYPHFRGIVDSACRAAEDPGLLEEADVIFLALPHGLSVPYVESALRLNKRVVDLGADFRLKRPGVYEEWYNKEGPAPAILNAAVYGLPEIYREEIKNARVVANPGCYPTAAVLALAPLIKHNLVDRNMIIIDSKSGVSGAGRSLSTNSLFAEVDGDFKAYGLPRHRHTPEIEQELAALAGEEIRVSFTPHLLPMTRGMLSTIYTVPHTHVDLKKIEQVYREFYSGEPFVRVLPAGRVPQTKWVLGTNFCDIGLVWDERTKRLVVISAIDNLVKGASGQAVQNMNIMCGFEEKMGLDMIAVYP
ncbi:MAG: N-acetyl-gamma-glutamyl-phosphate reductase [Peptococcaceae bacterium]|jgi:N-acetyl-gamma-glutamyl-phosphate reductase|nr:N-acetyl-gamma-glutamyl-phosphate reductase [Peptococcaceae bacterium]MDH7525880.1 N-acetyl-gamma-glutamyl-phosphate reductase [Peptococcaceae bacterium]